MIRLSKDLIGPELSCTKKETFKPSDIDQNKPNGVNSYGPEVSQDMGALFGPMIESSGEENRVVSVAQKRHKFLIEKRQLKRSC